MKKNKIGATITIGGTDWTNYGNAIGNLITMSFWSSYNTIVDSINANFVPYFNLPTLSLTTYNLTNYILLCYSIHKT
jgi:hypothetical protein